MANNNTSSHSRNHLNRLRLVEAALPHVAFDGWTQATFEIARKDVGLSEGDAQLACPREEIDLICAWSRQLDEEAGKVIIKADLLSMKIRERITFAVLERLKRVNRHEEAARRARARLLLPDAASDAPQLLWATADTIWRAVGDTSTDVNFYSKRAILSAVYGSTLSSWLNEDDTAKPDAHAFLDRRIQNVMDFEKTKGQLTRMTADLPDLEAMLGKIRHGAGL